MRVDKFIVRRVLSLLTLAVVAWWGLSLMAWGVRTLSEPPRYACATDTVPVNAGDTIYSIVRANCSGDTQAVIRLMVTMYGTRIESWQVLHLPIDSPRP